VIRTTKLPWAFIGTICAMFLVVAILAVCFVHFPHKEEIDRMIKETVESGGASSYGPFTLRGHAYLIVQNHLLNQSSVVHDPDCPKCLERKR
jgi:hypothetical protein